MTDELSRFNPNPGSQRRSRKDRSCDECAASIPKGTQYHAEPEEFGYHNGWTYRCVECAIKGGFITYAYPRPDETE